MFVEIDLLSHPPERIFRLRIQLSVYLRVDIPFPSSQLNINLKITIDVTGQCERRCRYSD
ncbi:protein of unknown function [Georgfuchsia toluolica]|uniref:Uncharacterized protein n=1 Tax=Georgfuchsia toluolica TaxID=424218 RepID=A0A916J367_9PROT|nr:protein of unknown function [Georgfuchsia toluolica]